MKKRDLKNAYGNVPAEFHNTVIRTLNGLGSTKETADSYNKVESFTMSEGVQVVSVGKRKRGFWRTAIACALIIAVGSVGVISAKAIYPMVVNREGNYGLNIELEPMAGGQIGESGSNDSNASNLNEMNLELNASKTAPEYVRINIGYLPDDVLEDQGKYSLGGGHEEKCFTFVRDRIVEKKTFTDVNIVDYEELEINGNKAILAKTAVKPFSRRFYIYFENEAAFVMAYVTDDVSDEEIIKVMENITVEECTAEEANVCSLTEAKEILKEEKEQEFWNNLYGMLEHEKVYEYSEIELGQKMTYGNYHESSGLELSIDNIDVLDNISDLDDNSFNQSIAEDYLPNYTDENGNFIPHEREHYIEGDGVTAPFRQVSRTDTITTKMVYVTLTVNNTTDVSKPFIYQGFNINTLADAIASQNGEKKLEDIVAEEDYTLPILWGDVHYIDNNNVDRDGYQHGYNFLDVPANSTQTIHIGFLVDEDQLDEAYITLDESWCNSMVFDSAKSEFVANGKDYYHNLACIKVQ